LYKGSSSPLRLTRALVIAPLRCMKIGTSQNTCVDKKTIRCNISTTDFGDRAFRIGGPRVWNYMQAALGQPY